MKRDMTYNIFIDDKLRPIDIYYKSNNPLYKEQFVVIKSYQSFIDYVENTWKKDGSYPGFISFDYLLSDVTMQVTEDYSVFQNDDSYTPTGLECAQWIYEFCRSHNLPFPKYVVHDTNPTGRRFISKVFNKPVITAPDPFQENIVNKEVKETSPVLKPVKTKTMKKITKKMKKIKSESKNTTSGFNKKQDKQFITDELVKILKEKNLTKKEIYSDISPKLPEYYTSIQKDNKIGNVVYELYKLGTIKNIGTIRLPEWTLLKKS